MHMQEITLILIQDSYFVILNDLKYSRAFVGFYQKLKFCLYVKK